MEKQQSKKLGNQDNNSESKDQAGKQNKSSSSQKEQAKKQTKPLVKILSKDDFDLKLNVNLNEEGLQKKKSQKCLSDCSEQQNQSLDYKQQEYSGVLKNKVKFKKTNSALGQQDFQSNSNSQDQSKEVKQKKKSGLKLLSTKQEDKQKQVVALIISFKKGCTYDNLFTSVQQQSMAGTRVLVYACSSSFLPHLINGFKNQFIDQTVKELFEHLNKLDPDCVVFNWQCCSSYCNKTFPQKKQVLFQFLQIIVQKGYMAMFSDFSLKALINQWPQNCSLGKNPFVQVGEFSSHFCLHFQNQNLINCPSAQLQTIGKMSENGFCNVHAMGGTIVYSVNYKNVNNQQNPYKLQVLTVTDQPVDPQYQCQIKDKVGTAGHVLLTYKSGGHILTSMGHWIELMKIDTSEKRLFQIAAEQYGQEYALQRKLSFECLSDDGRKSYVAKKAKVFVQNQAPCNNMERKQRGKKRPVSVQKNSQDEQSD